MPLFCFEYRNTETRRRCWTNLISFIWLPPPRALMQLQMLQLPLLAEIGRRSRFCSFIEHVSETHDIWGRAVIFAHGPWPVVCSDATVGIAAPGTLSTPHLHKHQKPFSTTPLRGFFFLLVSKKKYINLRRSNTGGNPSASSVITALLRQSAHSAVTVDSQVLCSPALFVHRWLGDAFKIFSVFIPPFLNAERMKPLAPARVALTLCLLGLSSWFWRVRTVPPPPPLRSSIHSEVPAAPFFSPLLTCEESAVSKSALTGQEFTQSHFFTGVYVGRWRSHTERCCWNVLDYAAGRVLNVSAAPLWTLRPLAGLEIKHFPLVTLKTRPLMAMLANGAVGYTCGIYLLHQNHNIPTICHQIC